MQRIWCGRAIGRADPLVAEGCDVAARRTLGDDRRGARRGRRRRRTPRRSRRPRRRRRRTSSSSTRTTGRSAPTAPRRMSFMAVSWVKVWCPDQGWVGRPVHAGPGEEEAARQRGTPPARCGESSPRAVVMSSRSSSGPTKARLVVCGAGSLDDVEQVTGGRVAAHLAPAPGREPQVARASTHRPSGHGVGELESESPRTDRPGLVVVVADPDPTAGQAVDAVEQRPVGGEGQSVGQPEVVVEHGGGPSPSTRTSRWECARSRSSDTVPTRNRPRASQAPSFNRSSGCVGEQVGTRGPRAVGRDVRAAGGGRRPAAIRRPRRRPRRRTTSNRWRCVTSTEPSPQTSLEDEAREDVDPEQPLAGRVPDRTLGELVDAGR